MDNLYRLDLSSNQLSGTIPSELGNIIELHELYLGNNPIVGPVPPELNNLPDLSILRIPHTNLSELPDLSGLSNLTELAVYMSDFTFEDIEPNVDIPGIMYTPQNHIPAPGPYTLNVGDELNITIPVGGSANVYQWFKDGVEINGATTDNLLISNVSIADIGIYYLSITSALVPNLTLRTDDISVDIIVGIKNESLNNAFRIYPTPVSSHLNIETENLTADEYTLNIVDLTGKAMINEQLTINNSAQEFKIDVSALQSGIYIVVIQNEDNQLIQKVVKK